MSSILAQVPKNTSNILQSNKTILVLGENETGKTSLIAKMQGNDDPKKGSGLEFHSLLVRDEYRDEFTHLGAWILDGNPWHSKLLKFALNQDTFGDTTIVLTVGMNKPWSILDSLEKWTGILEAHIDSLKLPSEMLNKYRQLTKRRFLSYISPGDEMENLVNSTSMTSSQLMNRSTHQDFNEPMVNGHVNGDGGDLLSPSDDLPDNILTRNLGLDIIVVVTLTDYMSILEKEYDYKEEHFDFIQQAVRKFCLKYGASLFYVSAKANKNCDLLYKFLVHRIYGLPFKTPALVVEKDALFIPAGWDNEKKIAILYENIQSFKPDDDFNDVITKPPDRKPIQKETEITAEDDQVFLLKMQAQLNQQVPGTGAAPNRASLTPDVRISPAVQKGVDPRRSLGTPAGVPMDGAKGSPGGEGVLQNFFNSLLNRKSGNLPPTGNSPRTPNIGNDNKSRSEVAAELDRMTTGSTPTKTTPVKKPLDISSNASNDKSDTSINESNINES